MGLNIFGKNIPENMDSLNVFGVEIDELIVFGAVVWKKQKYYFIAFLPNGGSGSMAQQTMPVGVATALASNAFSRTGYRFNGWGRTASQVSPNYQNGAAVTDIAAAGQTLNLYAIWLANVYYVDYNGNTATGGGTARSTHTYGVYKTLTPNGYSKTGYLFNGWTAPGGTVYSNQHNVINLSSTHGAEVTMSARWSPITYYIDYYGNTATGGSTARSIHTYDVYKTLTPNGFWKTGYLFNGWTANGGANVFNNQHNVINLSATNGVAVALYARWSPITYSVTYNGHGATGGSTPVSTHTYDVYRTLTPNGFVRPNYNMLGWSVDGGATVHYSNGQNVVNLSSTHGANINLFAVWAYNGNIFDNGGLSDQFGGFMSVHDNGQNTTISSAITYTSVAKDPNNDNHWSATVTSKAFSLAGYRYVNMDCETCNDTQWSYWSEMYLGISTTQRTTPTSFIFDDGVSAAQVPVKTKSPASKLTRQTISIDITAYQGTYYVCCGCHTYGSGFSSKIYRIWLS